MNIEDPSTASSADFTVDQSFHFEPRQKLEAHSCLEYNYACKHYGNYSSSQTCLLEGGVPTLPCMKCTWKTKNKDKCLVSFYRHKS